MLVAISIMGVGWGGEGATRISLFPAEDSRTFRLPGRGREKRKGIKGEVWEKGIGEGEEEGVEGKGGREDKEGNEGRRSPEQKISTTP